MARKLSLVAAMVAVGVLSAASQGIAATGGSLGALKGVGAAQSSVEKTHGWHRTCRRGLNGWHKHVPGIGRVQCTNHVCKHGKCWWY
ncbi:hypothetical protein [Hyphomicrobium sp. ghe19]|uniref:hypothetical protein n=1 Tax=Hyphomicrobium sp. ghe19 TaxID=2682968 RepID=UPI0013673F83|nr:hypothetical protein HYPP_04316 [Hyphomicrobium sp. ghe19]